MRIIIIDDEGITRQWLKKKIEEINLNYHVIGVFSNGKQALEFLIQKEADVIFTDIRMPGMDGLEFLQEVKERHISSYKVILSAYDEFHYVRQAMRLGANEFILKPEITQEGLSRLLAEAEHFLEDQKKEGVLQETNEIKFAEYYLELLEKISSQTEEEVQDFIKENEISLQKENLVTAYFSFAEQMDIEKAKEVILLFLEEKNRKGYCVSIRRQEFVLVYNQPEKYTREAFAGELVEIIQRNLGKMCYIGLSRKNTGFRFLKEQFRQAEAAKENRKFFHILGMQLYDAMEIEKMDEGWYYTEDIKAIIEFLEQENLKAAQKEAEQFFEKAKKGQKVYPAYLRSLSMEILSAYIRKARNYVLREEEEEKVQEVELQLAEEYSDLESMRRKVLGFQKELSRIVETKIRKYCYSVPVQEMLEYIEVHYKERICLEQMAERVHMNKTYISVMFKREIGINFSDYLQKVRLEKVKRFLRESSCSIQEIAEQTGFFDAAHLARVFKENEQMTPLEYKKRNRNFVQEK